MPISLKEIPEPSQVATVLTVYGIETFDTLIIVFLLTGLVCCNSTYRLRY